MFSVYLGSICIIKGQRELGWVAMGKMGPNNARCVIWAKDTGEEKKGPKQQNYVSSFVP